MMVVWFSSMVAVGPFVRALSPPMGVDGCSWLGRLNGLNRMTSSSTSSSSSAESAGPEGEEGMDSELLLASCGGSSALLGGLVSISVCCSCCASSSRVVVLLGEWSCVCFRFSGSASFLVSCAGLRGRGLMRSGVSVGRSVSLLSEGGGAGTKHLRCSLYSGTVDQV